MKYYYVEHISEKQDKIYLYENGMLLRSIELPQNESVIYLISKREDGWLPLSSINQLPQFVSLSICCKDNGNSISWHGSVPKNLFYEFFNKHVNNGEITYKYEADETA